VELDPDAAQAASLANVTVWDVDSVRELYRQNLASTLHCRLSPDGSRLAYPARAKNNTQLLHIRDLDSGKETATLVAKFGEMAFSPDARRLAVCVDQFPRPSPVLVLDASTGAQQIRLERTTVFPGQILFSPDGQRLVTISDDVRCWDTATGELLLNFDHRTNSSGGGRFQFSNHGGRLVVFRYGSRGAVFRVGRGLTMQAWLGSPLPETSKSGEDAPAPSAYNEFDIGASLHLEHKRLRHAGQADDARRKLADATAAFRRAIVLDPRFAPAYLKLGEALQDGQDWDGAGATYRALLKIASKHPTARYELGQTLSAQRQFDDAIAVYRELLALYPTHRDGYAALLATLLAQGRFKEAMTHEKTARQLLASEPERRNLLSRLELCGRLLPLEPRLSEWLAGKAEPANDQERLSLTQALQVLGRYAAAARQYADLFKAKPALAEDRAASHRYNAACCAALAGIGQGIDADKLDDAQRSELRRQALTWLRADLQTWKLRLADGTAKTGDEARRVLQYWLADADLAEVRNGSSIGRRSAAEQQEWRTLWNDTAELLRQAHSAVNRQRGASQSAKRLPLTKQAYALMGQGRFTDARTQWQKVLELCTRDEPEWAQVQQHLKACDRLIPIEGRLPDLLAGKREPANNDERLDLASVCQIMRRFATAARFLSEAFAVDPRLTDDVRVGYRLTAATCAIRAASGLGIDAGGPDDPARAPLRAQALELLRKHVDQWGQQLAKGTGQDRQQGQLALQRLQRATEFAAVRDPAALDRLPPAEQQAWRGFWADVAGLLKQPRK
jgi:tetratricopeptide (TPR) repeat protein